jgi:hypothetical protein
VLEVVKTHQKVDPSKVWLHFPKSTSPPLPSPPFLFLFLVLQNMWTWQESHIGFTACVKQFVHCLVWLSGTETERNRETDRDRKGLTWGCLSKSRCSDVTNICIQLLYGRSALEFRSLILRQSAGWSAEWVCMHLVMFGNEAKFSQDCILPFWSMFFVNKSVRIIVAWSLNINVSSAMVVWCLQLGHCQLRACSVFLYWGGLLVILCLETIS